MDSKIRLYVRNVLFTFYKCKYSFSFFENRLCMVKRTIYLHKTSHVCKNTWIFFREFTKIFSWWRTSNINLLLWSLRKDGTESWYIEIERKSKNFYTIRRLLYCTSKGDFKRTQVWKKKRRKTRSFSISLDWILVTKELLTVKDKSETKRGWINYSIY